MHTRCGDMVVRPRQNSDTLPECARMDLGKPVPIRSQNLVRDMEGNLKAFFRCLYTKGKARKNMSLLLIGAQDPLKTKMQKAEILNAFSVLVSTGKTDTQE